MPDLAVKMAGVLWEDVQFRAGAPYESGYMSTKL
jgi:hypothetical protein